MRRTRHFIERASQRGLTHDLAELALELGYIHGDRYVLGRRELDEELDRLDARRQLLLKARDKGGVVVVSEGGVLVTAYRYEGHKGH